MAELAQQNRKGAASHNYTSHVKLYKLFKNKEALKLDLGLKIVSEGFQYKVKISTKDRFEAVCYMYNCDWWIREKKQNTNATFQMVKLSKKHICSNTQLHPYHRQAHKRVLRHFSKGILANRMGNMLCGK